MTEKGIVGFIALSRMLPVRCTGAILEHLKLQLDNRTLMLTD
jgi:hypothetical protein